MYDRQEEQNQQSKDRFLHPHHRYYGHFTPENMTFNANLQEFAQKVTYIAALETGGKLSPEQAYKQIKDLWQQLKQTKKAMAIGKHPHP
ncbi:MAG TPA: hypothetical protein V6D28_01420 [Leptolyngbyaceae cyanobacterium]